jgi:hypothetical protein
MNMAGIFVGAFTTSLSGKSTDTGNLGHDMALLAIPVAIAIVLLLVKLTPQFADKTKD